MEYFHANYSKRFEETLGNWTCGEIPNGQVLKGGRTEEKRRPDLPGGHRSTVLETVGPKLPLGLTKCRA